MREEFVLPVVLVEVLLVEDELEVLAVLEVLEDELEEVALLRLEVCADYDDFERCDFCGGEGVPSVAG